MTKDIFKKIISLWLFFIIFTLTLPLAAFAATGSTVPAKQTCPGGGEHSFCLNIPIGQLTGFDVAEGGSIMGDYIKSWYGFMLGSVGILATVMIMWGGFKYLVSRGDKASIESAKTQMISAVTGVVLAFGTYTLLYLINPALLTINTPNLPGIQGGENVTLNEGSHGAPVDGAAGGKSGAPSAPCVSQGNSGPLDTNSIPASSDTNYGAANNYNYTNDYGIEPNLLRAVALHESSGNPNEVSPKGACGLMQILPSTASGLAGRDIKCEELKSNPQLSIQLAAQYFSNARKQGITRVQDQIAGYNAGLSTERGKALSNSVDCAGKRAWECCTNPGGLGETQNYVYGVYSDFTGS